jgi:hypothetical protein
MTSIGRGIFRIATVASVGWAGSYLITAIVLANQSGVLSRLWGSAALVVTNELPADAVACANPPQPGCIVVAQDVAPWDLNWQPAPVWPRQTEDVVALAGVGLIGGIAPFIVFYVGRWIVRGFLTTHRSSA